MKLKNKKTGEIMEFDAILPVKDVAGDSVAHLEYNSLAEFNNEWEDYEESKEYWFIDYDSGIIPFPKMKETATDKLMKQIGNYFETEEEAEKAVEKLKAWKRLKEARICFKDYHYELEEDDALITYKLEIEADGFAYEDFTDDLDFLFGGEE